MYVKKILATKCRCCADKRVEAERGQKKPNGVKAERAERGHPLKTRVKRKNTSPPQIKKFFLFDSEVG